MVNYYDLNKIIHLRSGDDNMKPNYSEYGLSCCMGEKLREEVERQLLIGWFTKNKEF
jgi:hypothetical protein